MEKIKKGIVFSDDIKRILEGVNAFDFQYDQIPSGQLIQCVRDDFKNQVDSIFNSVTVVSEDEMLLVNNLIEGVYPHCFIR